MATSVETLLAYHGPIDALWRTWPPLRQAVAAEQVGLRIAGLYQGDVDGWSGPKTRAARLAFAARHPVAHPAVARAPDPAIVVPHGAWPLQRDMDAFYGNPRGANDAVNHAWYVENVTHVACPWTLHMDKIVMHEIEIHKKLVPSLTRVLGNIWDAVGKSQEKIEALHIDRYSGSYNYRPKRGGSSLSCHGYAAALDFDSQENLQHSQTHLFQPDSLIVVKFEEEKWIWGGRWSPGSIDAMHFQAARIHE